MNYTKAALKGTTWVGALRGVTRGISFAKTVILARILTPAQFGIFGIASLILALLEMLTETGINIFLIQEKEDIDDFVSTSWIVSIIRGIIISIVVALSAFVVPVFFASPEAKPILLLLSLVPLVRGFINPAIVKFQKNLQFFKDFLFRIAIFSVDALVSVIFVLLTGSVIGIVWGMIAGAILEVALSHYLVRPNPRFEFQSNKLNLVLKRGKWLTGAGIFQFLFRQGDDAVVAKMMDSQSLGYYQMAYKLATLPITEVADVVGKATLPVYVKLTNSPILLKKMVLQTTLLVSVVTIPFGIILIIFSSEIITLLFGEKWLPAVAVLKVVAIYSVIRAISNPLLTYFLAIKKQEYFTAISLVGVLSMGIVIVPLVASFGIVGAAVSTIIGSLATIPFMIYFLRKPYVHDGL